MSNAFVTNRDPSELRTRFILEELKTRACSMIGIEKAAEGNEWGFAPSTFRRDMTGMVKVGLIIVDSFKEYHIQPLGRQWLYARREQA
jgi:hypothetical protein